MKLVRYFGLFAAMLALVSCGGSEETPKDDATTEAKLEAVQDGVKAGSAEDFASRVKNMVNFEFDRYNLKSDATRTLKVQAAWLKEFKSVKVTIEGHCDERGSREYNIGLGEKRANEVKKYLVAQGVEASRIKVVSYGEERPLDPKSTEEAWAKNRRAVTVIGK